MKLEIVKLPDVLFFQEGPGVRKHQFTNAGVKLLNGGNINDNKLSLSTTSKFVSEEEAYGKYSHFLVDEGDLVIASSGVIVEKFNGKIAFVKKEHLPLCMNTSTIRFKSISEKIDINYFYFFLKNNQFKNQIRRLITGSAQLNFGPTHLKKIKIPLPSPENQKRIAKVLSCCEKLIQKRKESIELLDEFLKSTFLEMFGPEHENYSKWPINKVETYAKERKGSMRTGPFGSNLLHSEFTDKGDVCVLGIDNVVNNTFKWGKPRYITLEKFDVLKRYQVFPDDVLISIMATNGRSAVVPHEIPLSINSKHLAAITLDQSAIMPYYLKYSFEFHPLILQQLSKNMKGAIMSGLNLTIIKNLKLPKPPIQKQKEFNLIVQKHQILKKNFKSSLLEIQNLYGSINQKAFKGELDLSKVEINLNELN
ncbi:restriction endonuclease subunit S [Tenacibaculum halocynthiae]|uniref:restriction endonuclease subunit S n=1 Tax=Tenacibaculum halocynthiae TaxID=1254437 RepID=UPI0038956BA6